MKHFLFALMLISGCNYIPCSSSSDLTNIKKVPKNSKIGGTYKPDSFTKEDFKEFSNSDSIYLILSSNGQIFLRNFPKMVFDFTSNSTNEKINGSGKWSCYFDKKTAKIIAQIKFDQSSIQPEPFDLYKKGDKYYILIPFGDPDNCTTVRLIQQ